jgi:SAM-dependent methyltransferase
MPEIPKWDDFVEVTTDKPHRVIIDEALKYMSPPGKALDVGAGALNESRFLLDQGFDVTAIDSTPAAAQVAGSIKNHGFHFEQSTYQDYKFPKNSYDLVSALYSLPFTPQQHFERVVHDVLDAVKPGGVFAGHFFGEHDQWNDGSGTVNFITPEQLDDFLADFEKLSINEEEGEQPADTGGSKYWHIFHVIARKK